MKTERRFNEGDIVEVYDTIKKTDRVLFVNKIGGYNKFTGHIYEFIDYDSLHKEYYDDIELRKYLKVECVYNSLNDYLESNYEK